MSLPTLQGNRSPAAFGFSCSSFPAGQRTRCRGRTASCSHHRIDGNQDALNEQLDTLFQQYGVKGCSVAAFEGEEIVYTHSYGIARGNQPADENTKYRIASISKAVTAAPLPCTWSIKASCRWGMSLPPSTLPCKTLPIPTTRLPCKCC